ncbi:MAG: carbamoyl-phosphate synthase small subunit [Planctomycetota bacterium]|nr:MAG: carbamoyl-phosphate synthase small subunit [Planctomycetota bacterium]
MSSPNRPAKLALSDGTVFTGRAFGADGEIFGEVVFNTSMTGYQEILTDPSYCGQIVTIASCVDFRATSARTGRWMIISRRTTSSDSKGSTHARSFVACESTA